MASEERLRELEEKYEGYKVYDNRGEKIGKVDDLFIDESDREEYIGVKMGFLGRKSTLIPMEIVRVNEADRTIEVSESKDRIKDAPSFEEDEDITSDYEHRIRSHFGLESSEPSHSRGSYSARSGAAGAGTGEEHSRSDRDDLGDRSTGSERGEHAGSSSSDTAGGIGGAASRFERGQSSSGREAGETSGSGQSEESVTSEEGGRAKVRRRIVREEIIEEDPDARPS